VLSHENEIRFLDHVPLVYVPLWANKNALTRKVVGYSKSLVPLYQTTASQSRKQAVITDTEDQYFKVEMSQFIISLKPLQQ